MQRNLPGEVVEEEHRGEVKIRKRRAQEVVSQQIMYVSSDMRMNVGSRTKECSLVNNRCSREYARSSQLRPAAPSNPDPPLRPPTTSKGFEIAYRCTNEFH